MLDPVVVTGWREPPVRQRYDRRDTILYNLALGAGRLPPDAALRYVWEDELVALPTMAAALASQRPWMLDPGSTIDAGAMVHGEQSLILHRPIPVAGEIVGETIVQGLWDNGPGRGAVLELVKSLALADEPDRPLATARSAIMLRGDGGFGGARRPAAERPPLPDRRPDLQTDLGTVADQALLYRLSGDLHRLHVDPAFARAAGFDRPILHGLCTYGIAGLFIAHQVCTASERVIQLDARFSAPVYPGDVLTLAVWMRETGGEADFRCHVGDRMVLDRGYVAFGR